MGSNGANERKCPRCGANRPDDFRWCRKCGLDYQSPPKTITPDRIDPVPASPSAQPKPPARLDVRPVNDRRNMAQVTPDAIDVRCLGTLGGWIGAFVGFLVFGLIGTWIGGAAVFLAFFPGILVGWWIGVRTALGLMAR